MRTNIYTSALFIYIFNIYIYTYNVHIIYLLNICYIYIYSIERNVQRGRDKSKREIEKMENLKEELRRYILIMYIYIYICII